MTKLTNPHFMILNFNIFFNQFYLEWYSYTYLYTNKMILNYYLYLYLRFLYDYIGNSRNSDHPSKVRNPPWKYTRILYYKLYTSGSFNFSYKRIPLSRCNIIVMFSSISWAISLFGISIVYARVIVKRFHCHRSYRYYVYYYCEIWNTCNCVCGIDELP